MVQFSFPHCVIWDFCQTHKCHRLSFSELRILILSWTGVVWAMSHGFMVSPGPIASEYFPHLWGPKFKPPITYCLNFNVLPKSICRCFFFPFKKKKMGVAIFLEIPNLISFPGKKKKSRYDMGQDGFVLLWVIGLHRLFQIGSKAICIGYYLYVIRHPIPPIFGLIQYNVHGFGLLLGCGVTLAHTHISKFCYKTIFSFNMKKISSVSLSLYIC